MVGQINHVNIGVVVTYIKYTTALAQREYYKVNYA